MIVKVCGMRDAENIAAVEQCGIDWMGFIFYPRSPRYVAEKPDYLPACRRVGVFVGETIENVTARIASFRLDAVQLHGAESVAYCRALREAVPDVKVIKVFSVGDSLDATTIASYEGECDFFLFDTSCKEYGGSGKQFNWALLEQYRGTTPFLLSGGLSPDSVERLQGFAHPQWVGIDLNSGFETAPAQKDLQQLKQFLKQIRP